MIIWQIIEFTVYMLVLNSGCQSLWNALLQSTESISSVNLEPPHFTWCFLPPKKIIARTFSRFNDRWLNEFKIRRKLKYKQMLKYVGANLLTGCVQGTVGCLILLIPACLIQSSKLKANRQVHAFKVAGSSYFSPRLAFSYIFISFISF